MRFLLLAVLPDRGAVPGGALLGGVVVLGGRLGGLSCVRRGGDDLGVDVDAGVGVREVVHGRVAGVGVGARVVLRVLEDVVEVAVHGAAAGGIGCRRSGRGSCPGWRNQGPRRPLSSQLAVTC